MTSTISRGPAAAAASADGKQPGGSPSSPIFGNLREMQQDVLRFMLNLARRHGEVARFYFFRRAGYLISGPAGVKRVLQENNRAYSKDLYDYGVLKIPLGNGLLTNDGESWLTQRRLMQPAFHRRRIAGFGDMMVSCTEEMLERRWRPAAAAGRSLDVSEEMHHLTLRIAGLSLFSQELTGAAGELGRSVTTAQRRISEKFFRPYLPMWVPIPGHVEFKEAMEVQDRIVFGIIRERRASGEDRGDLLSMLLAARDEETGQGMDDRQLRDEVLTLMLAGHETTANAMTWTWYLLSQHPAVWRRLREELRQVLAGRAPSMEDLPELRYTRMVIDEALRLYPPAWIIARKAEADDEIGGYRIPAGSVVQVSPYVTHRLPRYWENPEGFDPERFTKERSEKRPPFAYFPFGGGPRLCIGNNFALAEATLILATIARRFRLDLVPGHPVVPEPLITLRAKYGVRVTPHPV